MRNHTFKKVVGVTSGLAILSLFTGGAGFAAAAPNTTPQTSATYWASGYAPVLMPTILGDNFALKWFVNGYTATAKFPWSVSVYANSLSSLLWVSAHLGVGSYSGPYTGAWGPSWFQDSQGSSVLYTGAIGLGLNTPGGVTEELDVTDSGSWVPGAWQLATQYVYGNYPIDPVSDTADWLVKTQSSTASQPKVQVTHGTSTLHSVTLDQARHEMPFPVIKPPTNRFPIDSISATNGPGAPNVQFVMGKLFQGPGLLLFETDHKVTVKGAPNGEKTTNLAGYKATVAQWVNAANIPIASASIYNGSVTYTVIGTHVSLSRVESTLVTMLGH